MTKFFLFEILIQFKKSLDYRMLSIKTFEKRVDFTDDEEMYFVHD